MFELQIDSQTQRNDNFHRACLNGDTVQALRILDENPDDIHLIDVTRSDMPAILVASHAKAWDLCRELILRGVDLNVKNRQGYAPIHIYAENGHEELVKLAVDNAAFVNRRDSKGQSPLYYASRADREGTCELLMSLGGEASTFTNDKDTPMHWAARNGNMSLARKLTEKGGLPHGENDMGETPITLAKTDDMRAELERADLERVVREAKLAKEAEAQAQAEATGVPVVEEAKPKRRILKA